MKIQSASFLLAAGLIVASASAADAQECGGVSIAKMHWQSASLLAEIDRLILTEGYGCEVTMVEGDTIPTFETMNRDGQPDVAPEMWIGSIREELDAAVDEGRLHLAAKALSDGGVEGWWIPAHITAEHPEIVTIADALEHPALFADPENPDIGVVHNCPQDWSCRITTANLFRAYGAEAKGFVLKQAESGEMLRDSVIKAFEENRGWLGYYWAPTALLGKHDMVRLSFGVPYNRTQWNTCTVIENCPNPQRNAWPNSLVYTVVTDSFQKTGGPAYDYLARRSWDNRTVNAMLAWMSDNQATAGEAALEFLRQYDAVWMDWVTLESANLIKASLAASESESEAPDAAETQDAPAE